MKKKRNQPVCINVLQLTVPNYLIPKNEDIQNKLSELLQTTTVAQQQKCLIWLSELLKIENDQQVVIAKLLTFIFLQLHSTVPLKKTLHKILTNNSLSVEFLRNIIIEHFKNYVSMPMDTNNALQQTMVLNGLHSCLDNFQPGLEAISLIKKEIFVFLSNSLSTLSLALSYTDISTVKKEVIFNYLYNTSRILLRLLQKFEIETADHSTNIIHSCYKIISMPSVPFETKTNCGIIMVSSFEKLPEEYVHHFEFKNVRALELLVYDSVNLRKLGIEDFSMNKTIKVITISAILNVIPGDDLCNKKIHNKTIVSFLFQELISCATRTTGNPTQILEVTRALVLLSRSLNSITASSVITLFEQGLEFVWAHLEHYIDTVRHTTKTVFTNFINLSAHHVKLGENSLLKIIVNKIISTPGRRSIRYVALSMVCDVFGCTFLLKEINNLPHSLLENIEDTSIAVQICSTYELLMHRHYTEIKLEDMWIEKWIEVMLPFLRHSKSSTVTFYQRLIVSAYEITPNVFKIIQNNQHLNNVNELGILLGCLRTARKLGSLNYIEFDRMVEIDVNCEKWQNIISHNTLELLMFHQDDEIRVHVLALIVDSQKSTEIYTLWECNFLIKYLHYNITTQLPNTRKQILSLYKKAITRLFEGKAVIERNISSFEKKSKTDPNNVDLLNDIKSAKLCETYYLKFLYDLISTYLIDGLTIDANYSRRSFCLELLLYINLYIPFDEWKNYWNNDNVQDLNYLLLFESYETNKEMAVDLLTKLSPACLNLDTQTKTTEYLKNCLQLASDIKTNNTSAAYMFKVLLLSPHLLQSIKQIGADITYNDPLADLLDLLMKKISNQLVLCDANIYEAAKTFATHGILFSIRYLLEKQDLWNHSDYCQSVINSLLSICFETAFYVKPIVTNSSPEGFLPVQNDCKNNEIDESAKAQMLLVFAWRTMREITLLIGDLVSNIFVHDKDLGLLKESQLKSIVDFFLELFVKTKHRGVFEQASIGFSKVCHVFWNSTNEKYRSLPKEWLINMLKAVSKTTEEKKDNILCATRRSAGVPFMLTSILTTEPLAECNKSFHFCMNILLNTVRDKSVENNESRQHCMNILRAFYLHNQLGEIVVPYVEDGMKIAFDGLEDSNWNIRNSSTLLYGSLIMRIFGVQRTRNFEELSMKNKIAVNVFSIRYPKLYSYLLTKLSTASQEHSIFAVLIILTRLYRTNSEENLQEKLAEYFPYINAYLKNPVYKIRCYAAQASLIFIPNSEVVKYIAKVIFKLYDRNVSNNECHGLLLQLKYLIKSLPDDHQNLDISRIIEPTFWIIMNVGSHISYLVGVVYMEVVTMLTTKFFKHCYNTQAFQTLFKLLLTPDKYNISAAIKAFNTSKISLRLHLYANILKHTNKTAFLVSKEIYVAMHSNDDDTVAFCLKFLYHLNSTKEENICEVEDYNDSQKEYELVNSFKTDFRKSLLNKIHGDLKLTSIFNINKFKRDKCTLTLLTLSVLRYYPCILFNLIEDQQKLLDTLLCLINCDKEEQTTAVINCISSLLKYSDASILNRFNLDNMVMMLTKFASPAAFDDHRLAISDLIVTNKMLLCNKDTCFNGKGLTNIWKTVIILLEDDDQMVRNKISELSTKIEDTINSDERGFKIISEKAREELFKKCLHVLPKNEVVHFLLFWATRDKFCNIINDGRDNVISSEVFVRGDLNQYFEINPVSSYTTVLLKDLLWSLEELNQHCVEIKQKALLITTTLLNFFSQNSNSLMSKSTSFIYETNLKAIQCFFKHHTTDSNLKEMFNQFLQEKVVKNNFSNSEKQCCKFLLNVYQPILLSA